MITEISKKLNALKKVLYTITALSALLCACTNGVDEVTPLEPTATISIEVAPENRTYIDGENIYWSESGEQLNIIYYNDISTSSSRSQTATHEDYTLVDNHIQFTADFNPTNGATEYTFGAFYPYVWKGSTASISLTVPQEQTPSATSYDPKADILISKEPVVTAGIPDKITFTFARMVALVKMTLVGIGEGEKIEKVVFSSPAKPAGSTTFKVHEQGTLDNAVWYNNYEDITLNMGNRVATGSDDCWFATVPTELSGSAFTVTVTTDKFNYSKTVDLTGKTLTFERAEVAEFRVKDLVKSEKPKAYKLLTDITKLNAGDKVVICSRNYSTTNAKLLSTTISGSYKNYISTTSTSITISSDIEILEEVIPADAAVFTLEAGETAGTFALKDATKNYLYATRAYYDAAYDTINILGFNDSKVAGTSWKIELDSNGAKMSTCYDGTNSRYLNGYTGSQYNAAASRGTSYKYYIFYVDGENSEGGETPDQPVVTPLATPVVTATAEGNSVVVSWGAVAGAKNYTVTCGTASFNTTETYATLNLEYATEYTISVVANPADSTVNSASEAGVATVTTEAAPGSGDAEVQTITIQCPVDGAKSGNSVGTLHSGDINISSTGSWRTDSADGRDCIYIGRTTSNELRIEAQNGKTITKVILTAPVGYLVDLKAKEYDGYTTTTFASTTTATWEGECKSRIVYTAVGSSHSNIESITVEYK